MQLGESLTFEILPQKNACEQQSISIPEKLVQDKLDM